MQVRHKTTLLPAQSGVECRITAVAWSPNGQRLAIASANDRIVALFNAQGERKDKFPTKPSFADADTKQEYTVTALAFSPDNTKCAVAQSDGGIFVYKLGVEWGEKKVICNKFLLSADVAIITLKWPHNGALVFGAADGKVRAGTIKSNKAAVVFDGSSSPVVSMALGEDRTVILFGHMDGSVYRAVYSADGDFSMQGRVLQHTCPPYALELCGGGIVAAGNDQQVIFYEPSGKITQKFDYNKDVTQMEFSCAGSTPDGAQTVVLGSFDRLQVFHFNARSAAWKEGTVVNIPNFYTVTCLAWKPDGSRLVAGSLCGCLEMFECSLRKIRYHDKFEFTYVSPSQVTIRRISDGHQMLLKSHHGGDIDNINVAKDQFVSAVTADTLLVGDLNNGLTSEVPWQGGGQEKFNFTHANVCAVFNAGELSLIELGVDRVLGSCRTEHSHPNLISVRVNERKSDQAMKAVAYLADAQTIQVMNLATGSIVATIKHDIKIGWIQLSGKGNKLMYRDKRQQLFLFDVSSRKSSTLLAYCTFVSWVADSDVIVAQNGNTLSVWYNVDIPERVTNTAIKGDVVKLEKVGPGKTCVVIDEGATKILIPLDERYIEFSTAVEDRDYNRALDLLEALEFNSETESMWRSLGEIALQDKKTYIAEVCFAAVGDVAMVHYLRNVNKLVDQVVQQNPMLPDPMQHYSIRAKLAALQGQFKLAESIYLEQGRVDDAMEMYQQMHKWDQSISVAEARNHPELQTLKQNYYQWLLDSNQEERAAQIKEENGDYMGAISLYLAGGLPGRAAHVLQTHGLAAKLDVAEQIARALCDSNLHEKAGDLYSRLNQWQKAFDCYKKGNAYHAAIQLARSYFPKDVISLELQWAQHLVGERQFEAAVNHFIEAGKVDRAIEVAASAKLWRKVTAIVESMGEATLAQPYHAQLAQHYDESNDCELAEKFFTLAGDLHSAVEVYLKRNRWDDAYRVATALMPADQVQTMLAQRAKKMETEGSLKEAERLYLTANMVDDAINMYKTYKQYDQMIRLVATYHKDLLADTHIFIGKILEGERRLKEAEYHYCEALDWKGAVSMYCANNLYEEAYRVAKSFGGANASKQIAYVWAKHLGGDAAVKLLSKFHLLEVAVDFAVDNKQFDFAFELAKVATDKKLLQTVFYKQALDFEDQGKFREAELAFIQADKAKEAVLMYVHEENWEAAFAVAEAHDPSGVEDVLVGQATAAFAQKNYVKAETLVLRAQRADVVLRLYRESAMWKEALQFSKEYMPAKLSEVHAEYDRYLASRAGTGVEELMGAARSLERDREYSKAIDMYLRVNMDITTDLAGLESAWTKAVQLAFKYCPDRGREVLLKVAERFMKLRKFEEAAKLLAEAKEFKEAVGAYIAGDLWTQARELATTSDPQLMAYVESAYVAFLKKKGQADTLASVDLASALDIFAQRGEWDKCLQQAAAASADKPLLLNKYLMAYVTELAAQGKVSDAARKLAEYGTPAVPGNFEFYELILKKIFWAGESDGIAAAREMLFKLNAQGSSAVPEQFVKYLSVAHLTALKEYCAGKKELLGFAAKQAIALLRYCDILMPDRCFYQAGLHAKACGMLSMAFVCWNRYLDLSDAIEDGSTEATLDGDDFAESDLPQTVALPSTNLPDKDREDARYWILSVSLDKNKRQEAEKRNCDSCQATIYAPSLHCTNCDKAWNDCCVTGYPVVNRVHCSACKKPANKDGWNKFVVSEQCCPWCGSTQSPNYSV